MTILASVGAIAGKQKAFNAQLAAFTAFMNNEIHDVRDEVALGAWSGVTRLTPVDTGRARFSWNFSYGNIDPTVPPKGSYGNPPVPNLEGSTKPFQAVFVTSSLDYIIPLEEGHSTKSERMFEKTLHDLTLKMNTFMGGN